MRSLLPRSFSSSKSTQDQSQRQSNGVENGGDGSGTTHLYLNVYDLTPINEYLYWFGLGIFHSGIEEDGSDSFVSMLEDSDDEDVDHHLLMTPLSDPGHPSDKTLKHGKDIL